MTTRTLATRLITAERRVHAFGLIRAGATYRETAEAMRRHFGDRLPRGYDERYVYKDISRELRHVSSELAMQVEEMRTLDEERLSALLRAVWPQAMAGDVPSVTSALKILERRARLLGLDAPVRLTATVDVTATTEYREVRHLILSALESHPEARSAVASALLAAGSETP